MGQFMSNADIDAWRREDLAVLKHPQNCAGTRPASWHKCFSALGRPWRTAFRRPKKHLSVTFRFQRSPIRRLFRPFANTTDVKNP